MASGKNPAQVASWFNVVVSLSQTRLPGTGGFVVADFADSRDLDLVFNHDVSVEDAARCIAECVRHRRWKAPDPRTVRNDYEMIK
jgi:hypothetical protein